MKVLIVDDHPLVRKGLSLTLSFEENIEEIQEASNIEEAMLLIDRENPEMAIVDLRLGKQDGLEIVFKAKSRNKKTKFIILTSSARKEDFLRAQEADVDGYILKEAYMEDITYAFHVISRGKKFFDPAISYNRYNQFEKGNLEQLTLREMDILTELGNGLSNMEIAEKLYISENTVKKHVSSILSKLNLKQRTQAALLVSNSAKE